MNCDKGPTFCLLILQDSRLLGEIHIALLRSIIKDIEDIARTSSTRLGTNPNSITNSGGGHPQVVKGVSFVIYLSFHFSSLNILSLLSSN